MDLPDTLPEALKAALQTRGISRLYAHQRQAWGTVQRGSHVVVATPSGSGQSLCYTLPVVAASMARGARAL